MPEDQRKPARRQYPPIYEKIVPIGNILIAVGATLPAFGGAFSRMGFGGALYVSELLGAVLMFIGFLRAITPMKGDLTALEAQPEPEVTA
jgi:hypothetical protein